MLSEILDALKMIIPEVRTRNATRARSEQEFLTEIVGTCQELVEISDPKSDQATLLHEKLKVYYDVASEHLGRLGIELEIVMRALSSARIYYWVRLLEERPNEELLQLLKQRHASFSLSEELLRDMIIRSFPPQTYYRSCPKVPFRLPLEHVKQQCLEDIARLRPGFGR